MFSTQAHSVFIGADLLLLVLLSSPGSPSGYMPESDIESDIMGSGCANIESDIMGSGSGCRAIPNAPVNVTAVNTTARSILLSWDPPPMRDGAPLSYTVTYRGIASPNSVPISFFQEKNMSTSDQMLILSELVPGSSYNISATASSTSGQGPSSEELQIMTDEDAPSAPRYLAAVNITLTGFVLQWSQLSSPNGHPGRLVYTIQVQAEGVINSIFEEGYAGMVQYTRSIDGLVPAVVYTVMVKACPNTTFNGHECGNVSTITVTTDGAKPQLSPVGDIRSLSVIRGENVTIQFVVVQANPLVSADNITWTVTTSAGVQGLDCNSTSKHIFSSDCLSVTVTDVAAVDVGSYMVSAVTIAGSGSSAVDVTIRGVEPLITDILGSTVAVSGTGTSHTFVCNAAANPAPSFYWRFQEQRIEASANKYTISSDSTQSVLTVKTLKVTDEGNYECVTSNEFGTDSKGIYLTVQFPPVLTFAPRLDRDVEVGTELLVSCTAESLPAANIVWRRDDQQFVPSDTVSITNTSTGDRTVSSVLRVSDFATTYVGKYFCNAENSHGFDEESFQVNLIVRANITGVTASFEANSTALSDSGDLMREEFTSLFLSCNATGLPVPVVEWLYEGTILSGDQRRTVTTAPGYSMLALDSLQLSDAGMFTCRASNGNVAPIPGQTTVHFELAVQARNECAMDPYPCLNGGLCTDAIEDYMCMCTSNNEIEYSGKNCSSEIDQRTAPSITTQRTGGVDFIFAQSVSLECAASGIPTPVISWWKDGTALTGPQALGSTFTIDRLRPEDRGTYHCQATNVVGTARSNPTDVLIVGIVQFRVKIQLNAANRRKRQTIDSLTLQTLAVGQMLSGTNNVSAEIVSLDQINESLFIVTVSTNSSQPPQMISQIVEQPLTRQFQEYSDILQTSNFGFAVQSTLRYDGCPMETSVGCSNVAPIVWPETEIGQEVVVRCPCGPDAGNPVPANVVARRRCQGTYSQGAVWESENCTACEFSMNRRQICSLREEVSAPRVLASLTDISSNFSDATSADITIMVDLLQLANTSATSNSTVADMEEVVQVARNFLFVVDNIQDYDADQLRESNRQNGSLNSALVLIDIVTDRLALLQNSSSNETVTIALSNYGIQFLRPLTTIEPFALDVASLISATQNQRNRSGLEAADSPVSIEATLPGALSNGTLSMVYFLNRVLFPVSTNDTIQAGGILSLSMPGVTVTNLSEPFTLTFEKTQAVIDTPVDLRKLRGVFWDSTLNDGQGNWSSYGCDIVEDNATHCTIACNHFTSFSMLLDVLPAGNSTSPLPSEVLTTVTYLGCSVSAIALVIIIVTYLGNKELRKNPHRQLLINLSFTLLGLYVTFIITNAVSSFKEILPSIPWLCAMLSALLQYFFLGSFIAMAVIAFSLYRKLVVVFNADIQSYLAIAVAITWVVPVFIVGFSLAPNYHYYTGEIIAGETIAFCRAQSWPFYFGVVLPFALLYVFNVGLFVVIIISLIRRPNVQKETKDAGKFKRLKENFWLTVGLTLLLGLTWVFGFLATGALPIYIAIPFDILFTIFASFQGFFVFAFYCLKSPECRQLWKEWLHCRFSQSARARSTNRNKSSTPVSTLRGTRSSRINSLPSPATLNRNIINQFNQKNHTESTYTNSHNYSSSVTVPSLSSDFDLLYKNRTLERQKSVKFDFKEENENDFVEMIQFDNSSSANSFYFGFDPINGPGDVGKTDSGMTLLQGDCTVVANKEAEVATTDLDLGRDLEVCGMKMDSVIEAADSGNDGADGTVVMVNGDALLQLSTESNNSTIKLNII